MQFAIYLLALTLKQSILLVNYLLRENNFKAAIPQRA